MPLGGASLVRIAQLGSIMMGTAGLKSGPGSTDILLKINGYFYVVLIVCIIHGALDSDSADCYPSSS